MNTAKVIATQPRFVPCVKGVGNVNNFRRSGKTRSPRRNSLNFTRRRRIQRRFQARANEQKQFNMPWNPPRENFTAKQSNPPQRKDATGAKPMNNPNPFVPQGSVLEQNRRRSRMKLGVFCVLAVGVCSLTAMLIQGCKNRDQKADNVPPIDTNPPPVIVDTNPPPIEPIRRPVALPSNPPPVCACTPAVPEVPAAGTEYTVVKGDSLAKIAKAHGVKLKALEDANPNVQPTKLKVGQKLTIPAGGSAAPAAPGASTAAETGSGMSRRRSKPTPSNPATRLTKIAKAHGTTVKTIEAENNLTTTKIKVGQKLKHAGEG